MDEPGRSLVGVPGAIVIVGPKVSHGTHGVSGVPLPAHYGQTVPLPCLEVLGRSVVDRMIEDLRRVAADAISLLVDRRFVSTGHGHEDSQAAFRTGWVENTWSSAVENLKSYKQQGMDVIFIMRVGAYVELDAADALRFHQQQNNAVTRVFDGREPLDIWLIDVARMADSDNILASLETAPPARYPVRRYVNRLQDPKDLRTLIVDSFNSRCRLRPQGREMRPGVWLSEGAQVHRGARIVGPAFIGSGSRIEERCLITRCSNIESNCHIDYGTVVEDSAVLSNSYVGIGLDVTHSIVKGNRLLNLQRDVALEVADPCIIRENKAVRAAEASVAGGNNKP